MNRAQLQHVILELSERFGLELVFVVGSSAVFATLPDATDEALTVTRDVDIAVPPGAAFSADHIDRVMGEGSDFDEQNGYYAQGVGMETPKFAPAGWVDRARSIRIGKTTARCMEIHDLALAKYGAGREKDLEFTQALARLGAVDRAVLEQRLGLIDTTQGHRDLIAGRIARDFATA
jgi:hypothetical protein